MYSYAMQNEIIQS